LRANSLNAARLSRRWRAAALDNGVLTPLTKPLNNGLEVAPQFSRRDYPAQRTAILFSDDPLTTGSFKTQFRRPKAARRQPRLPLEE